MKSESYQVEKKEQIEKANLWDPFVSHIDSLYFSGAVDLLDKQTIAFEYDHFLNYFTRG